MVVGADVTPSKTAVAVMFAVPIPLAVTFPFASTVATEGLLELHVMVRPVIVVPPFVAVAVSWSVGARMRLRIANGGEIVTFVTASMTLIDAVPAFVSDEAITCAWPTLVPVTVVEPPEGGETVAAPDVLVQFTTGFVTRVPCTSFTVAVTVLVLLEPVVVTESTVGETATDPTGTLIDTSVFDPLFPSLVATITVFPTATAVTRPVALTVATPVLFDCQVTTRPVSTPPAASFVTAAS